MAERTGSDDPFDGGPDAAPPQAARMAAGSPPAGEGPGPARRARGASRLTAAQERRILEVIEVDLAGPLDLAALAGALGLSPWVFARKFRRSFEASPYAFVISRRLARARRLLAEGTTPIKAIAVDCGFADQSHLTRMFSLRFAETPALFRRRECASRHSAAAPVAAPGRVIAKPE